MRAAAAILLLAVCSCNSRPLAMDYMTWQSEGDQAPVYPLPAMTEPFPSDSARPWAGTISHHLLTGPLIDTWFGELAHRRTIRTFYILSPSHGERTVQPWAVARGRWKVDGGWVDTDEAASDRIAARLGVTLEPAPFQYEHGVHVFMPYIRKYFPEARVVAVVYRGEPPVDQSQAQKLTDALRPELSDPVDNGSFLLVSTDFSHHADEAQTQVKDDRSAVFWAHPGPATWILAGCDNRPGIYVLAHLLKASSHTAVLWHTNAYLLSGEERTNITSYFFTWVW